LGSSSVSDSLSQGHGAVKARGKPRRRLAPLKIPKFPPITHSATPFTLLREGVMPRHVEHNPYAVRPVGSRPGAGAKEGTRSGRPFADLLAEAESVRDAVRITAPALAVPDAKGAFTASGLAAAVTVLWHGRGADRARRAQPAEESPAPGEER